MSASDTDICGEPLESSDDICDYSASYPDGKCGYHTEEETDMDKDWKPALDHGLTLSDSEYYEYQDPEEQAWIDAVSEDLLDKSYYNKEDISMVEKCRQIAIDLHQKRGADGYVARKGLTQEKTVGFHEQYGEITETQENVLMITKDRLSRESRLAMKDLGVMDQDGNTDTDSESLIEKMSEAIEDSE